MKLLVVKEQLLAGGKDKVFTAVHAFEYIVLEFHDPVACRRTTWPATPALLEKIEPTYLGARPPKRRTATCNLLLGEKTGDWRRIDPAQVGDMRGEDTEGPRLS
jgi:hypothetical protein